MNEFIFPLSVSNIDRLKISQKYRLFSSKDAWAMYQAKFCQLALLLNYQYTANKSLVV